MERLTYEIIDGGMVVDSEEIKEFEIDDNIIVCGGNAILRLSAYEDTGLEPSQIAEVDRLYAEQCKKVSILKETNIDAIEMAKLAIALERLKEYQELGTVDEMQELIYLRNRYENENYDFCGEYGTEDCQFKDLIEAYRSGLLLRLPCKVGDMVYVLMHRNTVTEIMTGTVTNVRRYEDGTWYVELYDLWLDVKFEDFGKTAFLSREEAEQALKESEG